MYSCNIAIELQGNSDIQIGIDNQLLFKESVSNNQTFCFTEQLEIGKHKIWIDNITENVIEILSVNFDDISTDRLRWAGVYYPKYSASYVVEQLKLGNSLEKSIKGRTYMDWKGKWELEFTVPVFTWIHQTENLGWIYN